MSHDNLCWVVSLVLSVPMVVFASVVSQSACPHPASSEKLKSGFVMSLGVGFHCLEMVRGTEVQRVQETIACQRVRADHRRTHDCIFIDAVQKELFAFIWQIQHQLHLASSPELLAWSHPTPRNQTKQQITSLPSSLR